jgi:hypothetical protein
MADLLELLDTLSDASAAGPARPEIVAADLARGRHALIRLRRRRVATRSSAVLAAAAIAVTATHLAQTGDHRQPSASGTNTQPQQHEQVHLVDYTGAQPSAFRVSAVPAGWQVISSNQYAFVVAPPGSKPSADPADGYNYVGRIAVMLQGASRLPADSPTTKVSINGKDGVLGRADDAAPGNPSKMTATGDTWLIYPDAAGNDVLVQVPTSIGLTNDQIVSFARGITVTSEAKAAGG